MTIKTSVLHSLESINILLDREDVSYGEVRPFIKTELGMVSKKLANHPFADDLKALVDGAIAYSDTIESLGWALDELYNAVINL